MIVLSTLSDTLSVKLDAACQLSIHSSCFDSINGATLPVRFNYIVNTTDKTVVVPAPRPSTQRQIIFFSVHNDDNVSTSFSIFHTDGTAEVKLWNGTLGGGETMVLGKDSRWSLYRSNGSPKYS